ncbi:MAG: protein kinase [Acidobacteriota bacterium]|nr:protein kinase [Acidobacteriota bacterium]
MSQKGAEGLPKPDPVIPFHAGDVLADRFRVVRQIGSGGMGLVFEAVDQKLDRRVALKCAKPSHLDRLPPEVRAASEVSHFNICKVHDLHVAMTPYGETEFLSMEFIEGETLSSYVRRKGPLPDGEAREIARQICAGLAQAHRQGVVHGDLKGPNVILTQSPEGAVRAVITDFGLAKMKLAGGAQSKSGGGTLDYMAPELLLGERASVESDIYALGVLFHLMLTGETPGRPGLKSVQRETKTAEPDSLGSTKTLRYAISEADWRCVLKDLASPWAKIVARCLAPQPQNRFTTADALSHALDPKANVAKWLVPAAAAVAVAIGYWQWMVHWAEPVRLAVLPFSVEGGPLEHTAGIGLDVADRLSGARRNFTVISPLEARRASVDGPEKAKSILGATHVLRTRLHRAGSLIRAEVSVTELTSGRTLGELNGEYPSNDAPALAKAILATATRALRLRAGVPKESVSAPAYPYYTHAIGLLRQDSYNALQAIPIFEKAIELDPKSALPYAGLAEAQQQAFINGGDRKLLELAGVNVAKANTINADSVPVLLISGLFQQQHGRYESAIHDFMRATELEPNNPEGWKRLAKAYADSNRPEEAINTYRRGIQAEPNYYANYLVFGNFRLSRYEFHEAEELYRRVAEIAPGLVAGHTDLGLALMKQGRFDDAEKSLLYALRLRKTPRLLMNIGALYYAQEQYSKAAPFFEESIASAPPTAIRLRDLGDVYRHLGRAGDASKAYTSARDLAQDEVSRNPRQAYSRVLLALTCAYLGDERRAESEALQALSIEPENASVMREAAIVYEVLRQRDKTLGVLGTAPRHLVADLSRDPDVKELRQDPRFQSLLQKQ